MAERRYLPAICLQLGYACAICSFVLLTMQQFQPESYFYPLVFIAYAPLIYLANVLFLKKERTMRGVAILNIAAGVGMFAAIAVFGSYEGWASLIFVAMFCFYLTMRGNTSAMAEPGLRAIMLCMELSLLILVLFTAYCGHFGMGAIWCLPSVFGCAASILAVMLSRLERSPGLRGWLFIALVFLLIFLLLWLLVSYAAAPAGEGVVTAWNAFIDAVKFILGLIWKFILFLISLLPQTEYEEAPMEAPVYDMPAYEEFTEQQMNLMGALASLLVLLAIIFLVRLLIQLGKVKVGGKKLPPAAAASRRRISLGKGLRRFFGQIWAGICLRINIWRCRNTPKGLLCILIRKCRMGPWHKNPGETPREFLCRLRHASRHDEKLRDAIDGLIPMVDAAVYSPAGCRDAVPGAALIRRRIGRAVRGQFLRRMKKRIAGKLAKS